MAEDDKDLLADPTGGPTAPSQTSDDDRGPGTSEGIDVSAGAEGQDQDEGAVQDARDDTGESKENPG